MKTAAKLPFSETAASVLLDAVRALAALVVCLEHWRNLFFVDYPQIHSAHRWVYALFYVVTDAGHQAVIIFFVLSGYLISGSIFRAFQRDQWSWRRYLIHRLVRLWIVLIPALAVGALFDFTGIHFHLAPALYTGHVPNHMIDNAVAAFSLRTFAGNLVFSQGILVHTFGSNTALWSLANEFWYYILFPCALLALRRNSALLTRLLSAAAFIAFAWFAGKEIMSLFPVWLLGAALAALRVQKTRTWLRTAAAAVYIPLFFYLPKGHLVRGVASDYILGAATFLFLMILLGSQSAAHNTASMRLSRVTARFSYTLYLMHVPLLVLIVAALEHGARSQPDASHLFVGLTSLIVAIAFSFAVASVNEFRTEQVRGWIEARILPSSQLQPTLRKSSGPAYT
jgi:peptidoglycan/LPS O-acetylase OafA/YrhL